MPSAIIWAFLFPLRVSPSPQSDIEQLQAQLAVEQKRVSELNREIASSENRLTNSEGERNVLQRELDRLRQSNEELQADLSETQQQLEAMETSMKKATNTVTALKKVCFVRDRYACGHYHIGKATLLCWQTLLIKNYNFV